MRGKARKNQTNSFAAKFTEVVKGHEQRLFKDGADDFHTSAEKSSNTYLMMTSSKVIKRIVAF